MTFPRCRRLLSWASVVLVLAQFGCAAHLEPLSEQAWAQLGTVGVASARFSPEVKFSKPPAGAGAGAGRTAAAGAGYGATGGLSCGWLAFVCVPLGVVIGAAAGAVWGALGAEPAETVQGAEATLDNAFADLKIQEAMRDHLFQVVQDRTHRPFVIVSAQGPSAPAEKPDYRPLADEGIGTVLESTVQNLIFGEVSLTPNPPFGLSISVRARLVRTADGQEVYARQFSCGRPRRRSCSRTYKYTEWAANNAQLFREALERAYGVLAEQIVDDLFPSHAPRESGPQLRSNSADGDRAVPELDKR